MSVVLIATAGVTFALVLWQVIRPRRVVAWASLGVAVTSLVLALAISLSKIAAANDVSITGYRQTSYSGGALIGVLTAMMLVAASAVAVSVWTHISSL
ncbi:MAG TPA: hypothetical protein VHV57_18060 [Acidimicrobiales bacterium]|nr:hypothetical protein [Acidimicrobiales bacterium]